MRLFGTPKEMRTQLFFRDDGKFIFRKMPVADTFLVERTGEDIKKGWKLFYKLQFPFRGYRGIPADMVTLSFDRDIVFDPFGIVPEDEKPEKGKQLVKPWITEVADAVRYQLAVKKPNTLLVDKLTIVLGAAIVLLVLGAVARGIM